MQLSAIPGPLKRPATKHMSDLAAINDAGSWCSMLDKCSAVAEMGDRLATWAENWAEAVSLWGGELGPHVTHCSLGHGLHSAPSGILINPAIWPQHT